MSTSPPLAPEPNHRPQTYPALAALRLTPEEWEALARQGFIAKEPRGERTYFKLRFRSGGRQVVRYIGGAARAAQVRSELQSLQTEVRLIQKLKVEEQSARGLLRDAKLTLAPKLAEYGLVFHGLAVRRPHRMR